VSGHRRSAYLQQKEGILRIARQIRLIVALGVLLGLANGPMLHAEPKAKESANPLPAGTIPAWEALKDIQSKISGQVLAMHPITPKKGNPYYVFTIVDSATDEVKDAYVSARTGKLKQIIEHPAQEPPGLAE
jgi:hypothetical protein